VLNESSSIGCSFDIAATTYDSNFTESAIGKLQRRRVLHFLQHSLPNQSLKILEINCGTGEDALWLAGKGHLVIATDISEHMIATARKKIAEENLDSFVTAARLSFDELAAHFTDEKFDLIFSDFGGLNCISEIELKKLAEDFSSLLKLNGKLIAVVMGRKCWWERFYFLVKGNFKEAFRRNSKEKVEARIEKEIISTWYYSPKEFRKIFKEHFTFRRMRPVGLFVPPSYLNCFFEDKKFLLSIFNALEKLFPLSFLSNYADHFYIELKKR